MANLKPSDFAEFFTELHGYSPFPWQEKLALRVCENGWPRGLNLPTASGKTACIDIAIFALAVCGSSMPRRIFFVVDRRVIVDEAYKRAHRIKLKLVEAKLGTVSNEVALRLSELAGQSARPLKATLLRGGTYRDESWLDSPLQPAIIASTVDQIGSRLLFRGYGMRDKSWPVHAAMIGNDALIFLDEAHCSNAFAETLSRISHLRGEPSGKTQISKPFHFVEMTATPLDAESEPFTISNEDRANTVFRKRLFAKKIIDLVPIPGKTEDIEKLVSQLIAKAKQLAKENGGKRIAIMVNRVATAKKVWQELQNEPAKLVIGRMRPIDRDQLNETLEPMKAGEARGGDLHYVVSTQCLEVGADYDFDVIVSECASIDALLQRFGRLDRIGDFGNARGAILAGDWQLKKDESDPIYGLSLAATWAWLLKNSTNNQVNLGIEAETGEPPTIASRLDRPTRTSLSREPDASAALLPAHLDALVQTAPSPAVEPDVQVFLHGITNGAADVQVVWRADLNRKNEAKWAEILQLCPPCSLEAMPAQFAQLRRWLIDPASEKTTPVQADIEAVESDSGEDDDRDGRRRRTKVRPIAFVWRQQREWTRLNWATELRPGDTIVLSADGEGWDALGHIPKNARIDVADEARFALKRQIHLRLNPKLIEQNWPEGGEARTELTRLVVQDDLDQNDLWDALAKYQNDIPSAALKEIVASAARLGPVKKGEPQWVKRKLVRYPDSSGYVVTGWLGTPGVKEIPTSLTDHTKDVVSIAERNAKALLPANLAEAIKQAAEMHDYGKVDGRFQAWLRGGDILAGRIALEKIAKSGSAGQLPRQQTVGLPQGFRHEMVSLLFAEKKFPADHGHRDLVLHLVASHHGECRPFAPVVKDDGAMCLEWENLQLCKEERQSRPAHRLNSGVAERFWNLNREFGWWGLAYLEGLLRLADREASRNKREEVTEVTE